MGLFGDLYKQADTLTGGYLPGGYSPGQVDASDVGKTWATAPLTGLYVLGGGINELTGGNTTAWSPGAAIVGGTAGTVYSPTTQALSGYQGDTPGSGDWRLPVVNPAGLNLAGDLVNKVVDSALGFDLKQLAPALLLLGGAFLLGGNKE